VSTLLYTIPSLLEDAGRVLGLKQAARRIFTTVGHEVSHIDEIEDGSEMVITSGENFSALAQRWDASLGPSPLVYIHHADDISAPEVSTVAVTLGSLKADATRELDLPRRCTKLGLMEGRDGLAWEEVRAISQIYNECHLAASCGKDFDPRRVRAPHSHSMASSGGSRRAHSRASSMAPVTDSPREAAYSRDGAYSRTSRLPHEHSQPASKTARMGPLGLPERSTVTRKHKRSVEADSPRRWPANVKRPKVILYKNDGGRSSQCSTTLVHTHQTLLDHATLNLDLPRAATRLFNMDGSEVKSIDQLRNYRELAVSMGEEFRVRKKVNPLTQQTRRSSTRIQ